MGEGWRTKDEGRGTKDEGRRKKDEGTKDEGWRTKDEGMRDWRRVPVVALVDNIIPHEKRMGDRAFSRYFVGAVDRFVVMSRSVEAEMRLFTQTKPVQYVPHPIYDIYGEGVGRADALAQLGLSADKRYLLFFGFIRAYKGLDLALEAIARCLLPTVYLIVAGEFYEDEAPYRNLIKELGIEERVIIRSDFIPTDEVRFYFGAADLILQPYKSATQSGVAQIAYHFEKPMIVTDVGGLPEIVANGEAGYVVKPDPEAIAEAIVDFYKHDRAEGFIGRVREKKKEFLWSNMVEALKFS